MQQTTTIWSFYARWRLRMTKLNTKLALVQAIKPINQASIQAHDLSLLVLTIQAGVLKKQAIQANASAWIGLIVDNHGASVVCY
jgi:hypothetical protein